VKNDFTSFIYPLKINEYLSLGMAVLTTDFADLSVFKNWVRPVSSAQEAVMELARIEAEELHETAAAARITFAQSQSWEARADKMRMQLNG
jgi:teichuronic acid biosynthesis glycosyltransferase TuaH